MGGKDKSHIFIELNSHIFSRIFYSWMSIIDLRKQTVTVMMLRLPVFFGSIWPFIDLSRVSLCYDRPCGKIAEWREMRSFKTQRNAICNEWP